MILYSGSMEDGGAEARRRDRTMAPVAAVSIVEETKAAARKLFSDISEEEVEAITLRALYGRITPGQA